VLLVLLALQGHQRVGREQGGQEAQQARPLLEAPATLEEQAKEPARACREPARVEGLAREVR
jgi:hypothetical protein